MGLGTSSAYPRSRIPAPPQKRTTFTDNLGLRNFRERLPSVGGRKLVPPLPGHMAVVERPLHLNTRKRRCVVRVPLPGTIGIKKGDGGAGQEAALFVGASIHGVLNQ